MSYYKCKGIKRKGNEIEVNIASSNCFPITYFKSKYTQKENQDTLFWLYVDIEDGSLYLNSSLYDYNYAMEKVREYQRENNIDSYEDLYKKRFNYYEQYKNNEKDLEQLEYESYIKVYGTCYKIFKHALEEKQDNTLYTLYSSDYGYIKTKGNNGSFYYGYSIPMEKGKYKEMYVKAKMVGKDIQLTTLETK